MLPLFTQPPRAGRVPYSYPCPMVGTRLGVAAIPELRIPPFPLTILNSPCIYRRRGPYICFFFLNYIEGDGVPYS